MDKTTITIKHQVDNASDTVTVETNAVTLVEVVQLIKGMLVTVGFQPQCVDQEIEGVSRWFEENVNE